MLVRNFHLRDYAEVLKIWNDTGLDGRDGEDLDGLAKQLSWDSDLVLVAEYEGRVVGVIMGTMEGNRAYFYRLAVLPEYQSKGFGYKLVHSLEERFKAKGAREIVVMVNQKSQKALSFYNSLGYQKKQLVTLSKSFV